MCIWFDFEVYDFIENLLPLPLILIIIIVVIFIVMKKENKNTLVTLIEMLSVQDVHYSKHIIPFIHWTKLNKHLLR